MYRSKNKGKRCQRVQKSVFFPGRLTAPRQVIKPLGLGYFRREAANFFGLCVIKNTPPPIRYKNLLGGILKWNSPDHSRKFQNRANLRRKFGHSLIVVQNRARLRRKFDHLEVGGSAPQARKKLSFLKQKPLEKSPNPVFFFAPAAQI